MSQDDTKNITSPIVNSPVKPTTNNKKSNKVPFIGAISDIIDIARFFFFSQGKSDNSEVMISKEVSEFSDGIVTIRDILAPSSIEVDFDYIKINQKYYRTYFAALFPRFVNANWLAPLINFERTIDISMYYFTVDSREVMLKLRRKIAEMEATLNTLNEQGKVLDPNVKVALEDANLLQEQLAKGEEKFFHFSVYITIQTDTEDELNKFGKELETVLSASGLIIKSAYLQQEFAFFLYSLIFAMYFVMSTLSVCINTCNGKFNELSNPANPFILASCSISERREKLIAVVSSTRSTFPFFKITKSSLISSISR